MKKEFNRETIYNENFNSKNYNIDFDNIFPILKTKVKDVFIEFPRYIIDKNEILELDSAQSTLNALKKIDVDKLNNNTLNKKELSAISNSELKKLNNIHIKYLDGERNMEHQTHDIKSIINGEIN